MKKLAIARLLVLLPAITLLLSCGVTKPKLKLNERDKSKLTSILDAQSEKTQARYQYRNPQNTLEFFGVAPGQTVVEALPGGGWYSQILAPYLGTSGKLIGVDYDINMWPLFGGFATQEFIEKRRQWDTKWIEKSNDWQKPLAPMVGYEFGAIPAEIENSVDTVLFIRALHNLARFEGEGGYLTRALSDAFRILKPGGVVGIVQHQSDESMPDSWATGAKGYLKESFVKQKMEEAGFTYVKSSNLNKNPNDKPTTSDFVWRLPPSLAGAKNKPELKAEMEAIGESNRMTLVFMKPKK